MTIDTIHTFQYAAPGLVTEWIAGLYMAFVGVNNELQYDEGFLRAKPETELKSSTSAFQTTIV